jgi:hypothetical protein
MLSLLPPGVVLSPCGVGLWFGQAGKDATWAPVGVLWGGVGRWSLKVSPAMETLQG